MKRLFLYFLFFIIVWILLLGFIGLNLDYFLNTDFVKNRIRNYFSQRNLQLDYKRVHVNPYNLHFEVNELSFKTKDLELYLPKGKLNFESYRLFKLNFYPEELHLSKPFLKLKYIPKEEGKPTFQIKEFYNILQRVSPFFLNSINGTIEVELPNGRTLKLQGLNFKIRVSSPQLIFEAKSKGNFFESLDLKVRLNFVSDLLEGSLGVKKLDLSHLLPKEVSQISKTILDLNLEANLEKGFWNIGFTGSAPCLAITNMDKPLACGFFQGFLSTNKEGFEVFISPIEMKYPVIKGELYLSKKNTNYILKGKLGAFRWEDFMDSFRPFIGKGLQQELVTRIQGGLFTNLEFFTQAETLKNLFHLANFKLKSDVKEGNLFVPEIGLRFSKIQGTLSLEKGKINFEGETLIEDKVKGRVTDLSLNFLTPNSEMKLTGNFEGEANSLKEIALALTKEIEFLNNFELQGNLKGELKLEGKLNNPKISLTLLPENFKVKTPFLKEEFLWKAGKINYDGMKIDFTGLNFSYGKNEFLGLMGEYSPLKRELILELASGKIREDLVLELLEKNERLKYLYTENNLGFSTIDLEKLSYRGGLNFSSEDIWLPLLKSLSLQGKIKGLKANPFLQGEPFDLKSDEVSFRLKENVLIFSLQDLVIDNSSLSLEGIYDFGSTNLSLSGGGLVSEKMLMKLQRIGKLVGTSLELKEQPLLIKRFQFSKDQRGIFYDGDHIIGEVPFNLYLEKKQTLTMRGKVFSKGNDFEIRAIDSSERLSLEFRGKAETGEFSSLLKRPPFGSGQILGNFTLVLNRQELQSFKENYTKRAYKDLLSAYLVKSPFLAKGNLELRNLILNLPDLKEISGNFSFDEEAIRGNSLSLILKTGQLNGEGEVAKAGDFLKINGTLRVKDLDTRDLLLTKEKDIGGNYTLSQDRESLLNLPLITDVNIEIEKITLPTGNKIENLKGKLSFTKEKVLRFEVPEVIFCNLRFYAEYERNPKYDYVFIDLVPSKGDFLDLFSCLYPEEMPKIIFEGPFEIAGFFYADGEKRFAENSYGKVEIKSINGYIYRAPLLARVLGFLSPIDLFRGKVPNLENNLLPYEEMNLFGEFTDSKFQLDTFFLSAPGFRLFGNGPISLKDKSTNITFLVSPFKTLDVILEHIPYLNRLLLGKERMFIYLPLEVIGTYDNPNIIPLHPASIGKGFFRFIFKFFGIQEDFFKSQKDFEGFKKKELLRNKSGDSIRR